MSNIEDTGVESAKPSEEPSMAGPERKPENGGGYRKPVLKPSIGFGLVGPKNSRWEATMPCGGCCPQYPAILSSAF